MSKIPKYKCGYRLCNKSVRGLKPKRKYCTPSHANKERYLINHPEAEANKIVKEKNPGRGRQTKVKSRICIFPLCKVDISHRNPRAKFCENRQHSSNRLDKLNKAKNAAKKRAYYKRHGIVFDKTVRRRNAKPSDFTLQRNTAKEYQGEDLIYENYKEPLKRIEPSKGFGYYGTIGQTADKMFVQCHVCGNLFASLGGHLRVHKLSSEKYKEMYKLAATATLQSEEQRIKQQEKVVKRISPGELPSWLKEYNKKVQMGIIKHPGTKRKEGGLSLQRRNELGICPDQVLMKIKDLADILGRAPSLLEFEAHYKGRFLASIKYQHGSYLNAVKKLGMKSAKELKEHTRESLIEAMQEFYEVHKRTPMTSDFKRGLLPSRGAYFRFFGTLNNARIEAGLNAVIPMPFGQIVEMTPEQYLEYRSTRPVKSRKKYKNAMYN